MNTVAWRWALAIGGTGLTAGLAGLGLAFLLHAVQHFGYGYDLSTILGGESFLRGVEAADPARRIAVLGVCGLVAGSGWWVVYRWGRPLVSISRAVNTEGAAMPPLATVWHALLQIITVALGSPLGREVAPREVAAVLATAIARRLALSKEDTRILIACGAGAGLAAVYNVPLAGALFVLEGLLATFGWRAVIPAVSTSVIAALVARIGLGDVPQYVLPHFSATPSLIAWAIVAGPVMGLAAYGFTRMTESARTHAARGWQLPVLCLLNFLLIGVFAMRFPQLLGNGKGPAQAGFDGALSIELALVLLGLRVLITWSTLRAGAQGGLLTPGLCCGALLAIALGGTWSVAWPGTAPGAFALVGAAAFLASSMRVPLTAIALIVEFTHAGEAFLAPLLIGVAGSIVVSSRVRGFVAGRTVRRTASLPA